MYKILISLFLASCLFASPVEADVFVENLSKELITAIKNQQDELKQDEKVAIAIANKVLKPHVNMNKMAKMVLGKYVEKFSKSELAEFKSKFCNLVIKTYAGAFKEFQDNRIMVKPLSERYAGKKRVIVRSVLDNKGNDIELKYKLCQSQDRWQVYDMIVEGVSLLQNFKTQFQGQLAKLDADKFLEKLNV